MSEFAVRRARLVGLRNERRWEPGNWLDVFLARSGEFVDLQRRAALLLGPN